MKRSLLAPLAVFGAYLLIAVVVTWPLVANFSTAFAGFVYGDAYETAHHVWWFTEALRTGQSPFYQSLLAYPAGLEGVTLWADQLHFFPAWLFAFVLPLPAAVNLQTLLTLALNGLAMWGLARWLLGPHPPAPSPWGEGEDLATPPPGPLPEHGEGEDLPAAAETPEVRAAAFVGGLVFMLYPAVQGHLGGGHTGLIVLWPLPLLAWALLRLDRASWRGLLLAAALFMIGALGHTLQAIYALGPLAGLIFLRFVWRREWRAAGKTIAAVLLGGLALGLYGLPVLSATLGTGAYAEEGGAVRYSADLLAVVTPSFFHPVFGQWEYTHRVLGINLDEGAAFLGFAGLLVGLLALWKAPHARFWWGVALVAWLLSLGPLLKIFDQPASFSVDGYTSGVALPFAAVADLPLIRLARTPGRFNFLLGLAWAAVIAWGAWWLLNALAARSGERRARAAVRVMTGALAAMLAFEFQTFWPLPMATADIPPAITALRERTDLRAVFDVPWGSLVAAKEGLYLQTAHGHPLIAGQITRRTPVSPALLTLLEESLDPARLRAAGADLVLVHREQDDGTLYQRALAQLGEPLSADDRFAVFETPAVDAVPADQTTGFRGGAVNDQAGTYVYAANDGWWAWSARLEADGRAAELRLDGLPVVRWTVDGSQSFSAPVPVAAGYHTLALALDPPCPADVPAGQICRAVTVRDLALEPLPWLLDAPAAAFRAPGEAGESVALQAALPEAAAPGATLRVALVWSFADARAETDVRFVHVLSADGALVAQVDGPLGAVAAGTTWAEWVALALPPDLAPGDYRVTAGWYTYPELTNFCLLANDACAAHEALLGSVRLE